MNILNVTDKAVAKIKILMKENNCIGIKINIVNGGCMGLSYAMEYILHKNEDDVELDYDGAKVFFSQKAVVFLAGINVDYVETPMSSGFIFDNPNAKSRCGCGKSFCTSDDEDSNPCKSCH